MDYKQKLFDEIFERFDKLDLKIDNAIGKLGAEVDTLKTNQANLTGKLTVWFGILSIVLTSAFNWLFRRDG